MPFLRRLLACSILPALLASGCREVPSPPGPQPAVLVDAVVPQTPAACPDGMAHVEGFCIDRHEAHLVLVDAPDVALPHYERPQASVKVMARSRAGTRPQAYLNRHEAAGACEAAGKRLCRVREWYRACGGTRRAAFPYGEQEVRGGCNTGKPHVMHKLFGAVRYTYDAHYNNPRLDQEPGFLAATGEYAACVNDHGVHDMVGNLHEWVSDPVSVRLAEEVPLANGVRALGRDGSGAFMGGYFSSNGEHGRGCAYTTATHSPEYHDYSIGFRCCADARP